MVYINSLIDALAMEVYSPNSTEEEQLEHLTYISKRAEIVFSEWRDANPLQRLEKFFEAVSYWKMIKDMADE